MAMPVQTGASSAGEPSERAMAAGVRKMPSEMASPVTTAVAAHTPSCRPFRGATSMVRPSYPRGAYGYIELWVEGGGRNSAIGALAVLCWRMRRKTAAGQRWDQD